VKLLAARQLALLVAGAILLVIGLLVTNVSETVGTLIAVAGLVPLVFIAATWSSASTSQPQASFCLVDGCQATPSEEMILSSSGLPLVFAVCPAHLAHIRAGGMVAQAADANRGLIGLA
jgi:hypothetical protein